MPPTLAALYRVAQASSLLYRRHPSRQSVGQGLAPSDLEAHETANLRGGYSLLQERGLGQRAQMRRVQL